jgi:hypothetical protein
VRSLSVTLRVPPLPQAGEESRISSPRPLAGEVARAMARDGEGTLQIPRSILQAASVDRIARKAGVAGKVLGFSDAGGLAVCFS